MITTVLLDLDDTLLGNPTEQFVERYFAALSGALDESVSGPLLGAVRAIMGRGDPGLTNSDRFFAALLPALAMPQAEFERVVTRFYRETYPALRDITTRRPAARPLVDGLLARGCTVVVATNPFFPREAVEQRLAWAGVPVDEVPFALVTHLENMHFTKDHPEYYEETLARVNAAPSASVMVGDDWQRDIVPARRAGLNTFWIGDAAVAPSHDDAIRADGCGTLDDFARAALSEGWLAQQAPHPLTSAQIGPRLRGTLAALLGVVREQPQPDDAALLAGLAAREQVRRAHLQAVAQGEAPPLPPDPAIAGSAPDRDSALAQFVAARGVTLEWLDRLAASAWSEALLREADALAADDRAMIARRSGAPQA